MEIILTNVIPFAVIMITTIWLGIYILKSWTEEDKRNEKK